MASDAFNTLPPPAIVYLDRSAPRLNFTIIDWSFTVVGYRGPVGVNGSYPCPETHFQCPVNGYCLPVFLRCNGVYDCPGHEDEAGCDGYTCPGFYRCRASSVCVHASHVCDAIPQCPQNDDELLCSATCPENCTCYGLAFTCVGVFPIDLHPDLRYLAAGGSRMSPRDVAGSRMLVHLGLDHCRLLDLHLPRLLNLRSLDLSYNALTSISMAQLSTVPALRDLRLAGNPISQPFMNSDPPLSVYPVLYKLDLSQIPLPELNVSSLHNIMDLQTLNLSQSGVERVSERGFQPLKHLRVLDVRGCPMSQFPRGAYEGLDDLQAVYADNYKLCCTAMLPVGFNTKNCLAPTDVISSCDSLLSSSTVRVLLSVYAVLAVPGNLATVAVRGFFRNRDTLGITVFANHLSVANMFTGLYVSVIVSVDRLHHGNFLWAESAWKHSPLCKLAGFLFLMSTEASVLILCLLTADRMGCFLLPPGRWRLHSRSAHVASGSAWVVGLVLAAVPLMLDESITHDFYSQTSICLPLPVSIDRLPGHSYSLAVLVVLNISLLFFVLTGQAIVYFSIPSTRKVILNKTETSHDADIARHFIPVGLTHFAGCFLITLLAILASQGSSLSDNVIVTIVIVLLPLSPALTPLLFGYSVVAERRRHVFQERLVKQLVAHSRAKKLLT